jgi:RNA polymerase sigma factor (sigma-70 family)
VLTGVEVWEEITYMQITAITRYKHGELYTILKRLGWPQNELARRTNLSPGAIGDIINLVRRPTPRQADLIQKVLGNAGQFLDVLAEWPEAFSGIKRGCHEQTVDVPLERLIDHPEVLQIAMPQSDDSEAELEDRVWLEVESLEPSQRRVINDLYSKGKSFKEVAEEIGITGQAVRLRGHKAVRKLQRKLQLAKAIEENARTRGMD